MAVLHGQNLVTQTADLGTFDGTFQQNSKLSINCQHLVVLMLKFSRLSNCQPWQLGRDDFQKSLKIFLIQT